MKKKRIPKTTLVEGMNVKAEVLVEHESGFVTRSRVLRVMRVEARTAELAGLVITQHIAILSDKYGKIHEYDLSHPLRIKNKRGKWVQHRGC